MSDKLKDLFHRTIAVASLAIVLFGAGCRVSMSSLQSSFFTKFSLRELIKGNAFTPGLECSDNTGGGISMGTGGVGAELSSFEKSESCLCQVIDAKLFDEAKFIEALKVGVETELGANKATIVSSKDSAGGFSLEYASSEIKGTVQISRGKGIERFYMLQAKLTETEGTK